MTKTYQNLISPIFSTFIEVDGERRDIRFVIGGKVKPTRVNGKFRTSDPKIIEAMDNSEHYGKKWVCVSTDEALPEPVVEEVEQLTIKEIHGPTNVKEMREYLNQKMGVPYSKMPNRDAAFRVAQSMNIEFVNVN